MNTPEGIEVKGLGYPGREANFDGNSQVPRPTHSGRSLYYVFGRYPSRPEGNEYPVHAPTTVVRFSRTASDGYPIRDWNRSFPAVDTATVWDLARGRIAARRDVKLRGSTAKFVRNPNADALLWRIEADRLRSFTHREYARLQTFPDSWEFIGKSKRDIHLQIGNAVPVRFAERLARNLAAALDASDSGRPFRTLEDSHHIGG